MTELSYMLRAKLQCIWIDTYEENEVMKDLKEIVAENAGMKLFSWTHTEGLKEISLHQREEQKPADKKVTVDKIFDIIKAAQENKGTKEEAIYVMKDLHLINDAHTVKRMMRDTKEAPTKNYNPIIVVSPMVNIPIEHEKLFTILHYDTPCKADIERQVQKMAAGLAKAVAAGKNYKVPTAEESRHIVDACVGLTYNEITDVLALSVTKYGELSLRAIMAQKIQLVEKSGVLDYKIPEVQFEEVGGNNLFKNWIEEIEDAMSDEARAFGCLAPKGYMALGVPGTAI